MYNAYLPNKTTNLHPAHVQIPFFSPPNSRNLSLVAGRILSFFRIFR
jgi:hypothetical protein